MRPLLALEGAVRRYRVGPIVVDALLDASLEVGAGEFVAITGPSGSGKSTLLHVLGLLERLDEGRYCIDGREAGALDDDARSLLRNRKIGFVFQHYPLLPRLTALENVAVPLLYRGLSHGAALAQARHLLVQLGLDLHLQHRPAELSGGQQQRVAIARALVARPAVLLADEPTASLDPATGAEMLDLLVQQHRREGMALVLITHELEAAARAQRRLHLANGRLAEVVAA